MTDTVDFVLYGERAKLTTDHATSYHGVPVLVFGGEAHGPEDYIQLSEGVVVQALYAVNEAGIDWAIPGGVVEVIRLEVIESEPENEEDTPSGAEA